MKYVLGHRFKAPAEKVAAAHTGTGVCACGCGQPTPIAKRTVLYRGYVKGQPLRFIPSHTSQIKDPLKLYAIDPASGCWNWLGRINRYGFFGPRQAHIVVYERVKGPVPAGLQLDHLCMNRRCVNPDHLEPVTPKENTRRAIAARRTPCRS